jgi:3-oxoacyl-[acyl-carrier-protein] synthase II
MTADAHHITAPAPDGAGAQDAMRLSLADGGVRPDQVGYVNAHGTSTPYGDAAETAAVKAVFGEHARKLVFGSTKSMTGHLLGAAGGLEGGITALAVKHQILPPTINYDTPDPDCDLDYVPNHKRPAAIEYALSNSFGFGGTNGALLFKRYDE